ncbi:MAG: protein kinase [Pseudonocardia sp.]|nr:MAG: protein kinase [Pseudonocardia sp.]
MAVDRSPGSEGAVLEIARELESEGFADVAELGRGGFGVVLRCLEPVLRRTVAVKVLCATMDEENRMRFLREQQAMGQLSGHPHIVNIFRSGVTVGDRPFIVMQYHAHGSLDDQLRRGGPLAWETALRIGVKLAGALETAHGLGILHRDIKPGNILLTRYGEPQLTDFGIARMIGGFQTDAGAITGSPAYTAPEVLSGDPPSIASDIYGIGATLFCLLTGHAAFERRSGEQLVAQFVRITSQAAPRLGSADLPEDVCDAIEQAMARAPSTRFDSAGRFGDCLRALERRHGMSVDDMALPTELTSLTATPVSAVSVDNDDLRTWQDITSTPTQLTGVQYDTPRKSRISHPASASTRYRPPTPTHSLVLRARLESRLKQAGRRRLILIHAPAGYGKSTVAAQWRDALIAAGVGVAWFSVDEDDNNVVWFLTHLTEAIRHIRPSLSMELGQLLEEYGVQAERYALTTMINEVHSAGEPLTVVIDDWHRVTNQASIDAMQVLLDEGCHHLQFLVTSRSRAALPLSRMRVNDELVEIDSSSLRFDAEESRQLLVDLQGLALSPPLVADLTNSTDGWIAALQLASLSLRDNDDPAGFISHLSGRHRVIGEYLAENVVNSLEPAMLDFVLTTAVTERICGGLADALAHVDSGQKLLEEVEERDLFLHALDDEREWFRYHHLFAQFLRRRLERDHPGRSEALHRAASQWLAEHNHLSDAVHHSIAAGDKRRALDLVEANGLDLIEQSHMASVLGLISKLPDSLVTRRPRIQLAKTWAHVLLHHPPTIVHDELDRLDEALQAVPATDEGAVDIRVEAGLARAAEDLFEDRIDNLTEPATECFARKDKVRPFVIAGASNIASFESLYRYDFEEAMRRQQWARTYHERSIGPFTSVYGDCFAGLAAYELLEISQAEAYFRHAYSTSMQSGGSSSHAARVAGAIFADLLYEQNCLDEAERLLDDCYKLGAEGGAVDVMLATYATGSRIKAIRGDLDAAASRLAEGAKIAASLKLPRLAARIANEQLRLGFISPHTFRERGTVEGARASSDRRPNGIVEITAQWEEDTRIRQLLRRGSETDLIEALQRSEALVKRTEQEIRPRASLRARILHASALHLAYGGRTSRPAVAPLVVTCEQQGLVRTLIDESDCIGNLLVDLQHQSRPLVAASFLARVLSADRLPQPGNTARA